METEKLAAELIVKIESEIGRELTNIEKVAWVGAVGAIGRLAGSAFNIARPILPKGVQTRAQNWGKAISTAYGRSQAQGMNNYDTFRRILGAAAKQDPTLTVGTLSGIGFLTGKSMNRPQPMQPRAPMMPVYANNKTFEHIEKVAKEEQRESKDKWLYAGAGAAAGLLLGIRNKATIAKLKDKQIEESTKNLRELGTTVANKYKDFRSMRDQEFSDLFKDISDPKHKAKVMALTKDIDRVIRETGSNIPKGVDAADVSRELKVLIDKAHDSGDLPAGARDFLRRSVDNKFQTRYSRPNTGRPRELDNLPTLSTSFQHVRTAPSAQQSYNFNIVTPDDIIKNINKL